MLNSEQFEQHQERKLSISIHILRTVMSLTLLMPVISRNATAIELSPSEAGGRKILADNCGRCHALDPVGDSPLPAAPPFRKVYGKFSVEELETRLSEGVVSHFKGMPQVDFTSEQITQIIDYLDVLRAASPK